MPKELHISIDTFIGTEEKDGREVVGYMPYMLEGALEANSEATELTVLLDCPGGCTYQGGKIYNRLITFRNTPGNTLTIINTGLAASYATVLMQAATPGRRLSYPLAPFMVHKPLYPQLDWVNGDDLGALKAELDTVELALANIYANASGRTIEEIQSDMRFAITMAPEMALSKGYIDQIIEPDPSYTPKKREAKAIAFYNPPKKQKTEIQMNEDVQISLAAKIVAGLKDGLKELIGPKNEEAPAPPAPVANSAKLENGSSIYFDGELEENKMVFTDEAMTVSAGNGEYTLEDGRVIAVEAGAVKSITPAPAQNSAELEEKNARIAELEQQLEAAKAEASAKDATISNYKAQLSKVPGNNKPAATPPQAHAGEPVVENNVPTAFTKAAEILRNKYNRK